MSFKVWSIDDGYADTKYATENIVTLTPSFCTNWRPLQNNEFDKQSDSKNYLSVEFQGNKYLVGQSAVDYDSNISWVGGENKHKDKLFPILFNTCLGLMSEEEFTTVDTLVMGLPVNCDTKERREFLQYLVKGDHEIKLSFNDEKYQHRQITIRNLIIRKQPFGSLCDVILNDEGGLVEKEVARQFNVVADIGARTFNIYTSDALETVPDLTTHTNNGMYTAYQLVGQFIEQKLNILIPDGKLPTIVRNQKIKNIDLSPVINRSYEYLANEIKRVLDKLLINSWAFVDRIIFTGGGAEVLKPYLSQMFLDKNILFLDRYSTVRGLRKYGLRKTSQFTEERQEAKYTYSSNSSQVYMKVGNDAKKY